MFKIPTSFSNIKYCSVLFSFLVFLLIMSGCSPVTEETIPNETYTIPETESYKETIPSDPKPEGYLAGNDTITVYQQEGDWSGDYRIRVEHQGEEPVEIRLSSDNGCTAEILDDNTILFTIYEGSGWYQMRYDLSTGNSQHTREETGYLLQKIGLTPEETVSMRYMSYWLDGEVCTEAEAITEKEYYHWREYRGERSLEKTSLVQTDMPTDAEIRTHFQTMVDFVEYENALPSNTLHNPLAGNDRYYRNEYRAVNTPAALEYVFSCFLTQADTEELMQSKNADGEIWWKQDTRGYLYVSPVSFGLAEYRDQPMDIVRETDGNYRVTVSGREFLYVLESGCWRWKLTSQENEQTEFPTEPVKSIVPQEAEEQAALLTEQIVMHVMSMDWLQQPGYPYTDWDLHWFIVTMPKYRNTLAYPYYEWMEIQDDTWFLFPKKAAEQAIYELFGIENYTLPTEDDLYDAETDSYKRNLGSGTHTTMFWYEGMQITSEEDLVYVDCDLVSSREFEWEEMFYGRYRFTYRCCTDGERTFLRLEGYERILKTLQNTQDFPDPDKRIFRGEYGAVYQVDDSTLRVIPAQGAVFSLQCISENGCSAWIQDESTLSIIIYENNDWYEITVNMQTQETVTSRQEKTELLKETGLDQTDVLSMRYISRVDGDRAFVNFDVLTRTEYYIWQGYPGELTVHLKESLLQTETPSEEEIYENFQKMIRFVNHELTLNTNSQHNRLDTGNENDLYFRNEEKSIDTPETLAYVFSCFLTQADTETLLGAKNYNGDSWWKTDENGYLYISSVSFGLSDLYGQEMTITEAEDGNYDVVVNGREFRYVWENAHWCWQLDQAGNAIPSE